jgi:hypothetical protein
VTGDAETKYAFQGTTLDTQATVLQTKAMVERDYQRIAPRPGFLACLREVFLRQAPKEERLVSTSLLPFPRVGDHTLAIRFVVDVSGAGHPTVRTLFDIVEVARGRTEMTVLFGGPDLTPSDPVLARTAEIKVARILSAKAPAR